MDKLLTIIYAVLSILDSITHIDLVAVVVLVIIGIIIIMLIRLLVMLIPAMLFGLVTWFFTGSLFWAGIAFLAIAALSALKKL